MPRTQHLRPLDYKRMARYSQQECLDRMFSILRRLRRGSGINAGVLQHEFSVLYRRYYVRECRERGTRDVLGRVYDDFRAALDGDGR